MVQQQMKTTRLKKCQSLLKRRQREYLLPPPIHNRAGMSQTAYVVFNYMSIAVLNGLDGRRNTLTAAGQRPRPVDRLESETDDYLSTKTASPLIPCLNGFNFFKLQQLIQIS